MGYGNKIIIKTMAYNDKSFAHELAKRCSFGSIEKLAGILSLAGFLARFSPSLSGGRLGWGWDGGYG